MKAGSEYFAARTHDGADYKGRPMYGWIVRKWKANCLRFGVAISKCLVGGALVS